MLATCRVTTQHMIPFPMAILLSVGDVSARHVRHVVDMSYHLVVLGLWKTCRQTTLPAKAIVSYHLHQTAPPYIQHWVPKERGGLLGQGGHQQLQ